MLQNILGAAIAGGRGYIHGTEQAREDIERQAQRARAAEEFDWRRSAHEYERDVLRPRSEEEFDWRRASAEHDAALRPDALAQSRLGGAMARAQMGNVQLTANTQAAMLREQQDRLARDNELRAAMGATVTGDVNGALKIMARRFADLRGATGKGDAQGNVTITSADGERVAYAMRDFENMIMQAYDPVRWDGSGYLDASASGDSRAAEKTIEAAKANFDFAEKMYNLTAEQLAPLAPEVEKLLAKTPWFGTEVKRTAQQQGQIDRYFKMQEELSQYKAQMDENRQVLSHALNISPGAAITLGQPLGVGKQSIAARIAADLGQIGVPQQTPQPAPAPAPSQKPSAAPPVVPPTPIDDAAGAYFGDTYYPTIQEGDAALRAQGYYPSRQEALTSTRTTESIRRIESGIKAVDAEIANLTSKAGKEKAIKERLSRNLTIDGHNATERRINAEQYVDSRIKAAKRKRKGLLYDLERAGGSAPSVALPERY